MNRTRTLALFIFLAFLGVAVAGVISMMQVRLRADKVGQGIREIERKIASERKELDHLERERARAQDVLQLTRRVGDDLRPPEPNQVVWIRPPLSTLPRTGTAQNPLSPRMAALNSAAGQTSGLGGATAR